MRYSALHGSPGPLFSRFDASMAGQQSGYDHALDTVCFTSEYDVAAQYAEQTGFIGLWGFSLQNPLECDDANRPMGIASFLEHARSEGHDGVILRNCSHTAISPGAASDIFYVLDPSAPRLLETVQDGPEAPPLSRKSARASRRR